VQQLRHFGLEGMGLFAHIKSKVEIKGSRKSKYLIMGAWRRFKRQRL